MTELAAGWPPTNAELSWRPPADAPMVAVTLWHLDLDEQLPAWVPGGTDVLIDDRGDVELPAYALATVKTDAGRPGGGGCSTVWAVPGNDAQLHLVITCDDEIPFRSPIPVSAELPTLGQLLHILDHTLVDGDEEPFGLGHTLRERNDVVDSEGREHLRSFVSISSRIYPQLEGLDQARLDAWIAERP